MCARLSNYLCVILTIEWLVSTNAQNDALLHKLVHTKILSGSLDPDLDMTPAQRRKALAGRVLEAAGHAKLGKGETAVRAKERNKAAKHVRDGLIAKKKERTQKQLEEVWTCLLDRLLRLHTHSDRQNTWAIIIPPSSSSLKTIRTKSTSLRESED